MGHVHDTTGIRLRVWHTGRLGAALVAVIGLVLGAWLTVVAAGPAGAVGNTISGHVFKTGGAPVQGAQLECQVASNYESCGTATTGPNGAYLLTSTVPSDDYYLIATVPVDNHFLAPQSLSQLVDASGGSPTDVDFTFTIGGEVTGSVTSGGSPITAGVSLHDQSAASCDNGYIASGFAGAGQPYSITAEAGTYKVCATSLGYVTEMRPGTVSVVSGQTITGIDLDLDVLPPVTISGTVKDPANQLVVGATVQCAAPGCTSTQTAGNGTFTITGPSGQPFLGVYADPPTDTQYLQPGATDVDTTAGNVTGAQITLAEGGRLAGTVTTTTGPLTPSQSAQVSVIVLTSTSSSCTDDAQIMGGGLLEPNGTYSILMGPGTYRVCASIAGGTPVDHGSMVTVVAGQTTSGRDITLQGVVPRTISGVVKDSGGSPVANASVTCFGDGCTNLQTGANGTFSITGPGIASLTVHADPPPASQFLLSTEATVDASGGNVSGVQLTLPQGGRAIGTVSTTSGPLTQSQAFATSVTAFTSTSTGCGDFAHIAGSAFPSSGGGYALKLPAGSYRVCASLSGFTSTDHGSMVTVTTGQTTSGVNVVLGALAPRTVTGVVKNNGGTPISGVQVSCTTLSCDSDTTGGDGAFSITVPGQANLTITALPPVAQPYLQPSFQLVDTSAGDLSGVQITLNTGGKIRGTVSKTTGPLTSGQAGNTSVVVLKSTATSCSDFSGSNIADFPNVASNGTYVSLVSPGSYKVCASLTGFTTTAHGSTVTVTASQDTTGVNIALPPEGVEATVPGAPTIGASTPGNTNAKIAFTAPGDNGGDAITSYTATCTAPSRPTRTGGGASSPVTVSGLVNGVQYSCTVHATNSVGSGSESGAVGVKPLTTPAAPKNVVAEPTGLTRQLKVTFTATPAASNGGAPVTGYKATCTSPGKPAATLTKAASPIVLNTLTDGKSYSCAVQAQNAAGLGPSSAPLVSAKPGAPSVPATISVSKGTVSATLKVTIGRVTTATTAKPTGYTATCTATGSTKTVTAKTATITLSGLNKLKSYLCKGSATNKFGAGPFKQATVAVKPK